MPNLLPHSVKCSGCGDVHSGMATHPFEFIAAIQAIGWIIPAALENKPIVCPKCNKAKTS